MVFMANASIGHIITASKANGIAFIKFSMFKPKPIPHFSFHQILGLSIGSPIVITSYSIHYTKLYDNSRKIAEVRPNYFRVPLSEPLVDAKHGTHTHFELVTATVVLEDGSEGTGYTYTGGFGGRAIYDMIKYDLAPGLIGEDGDTVEALWEEMNWRVHYVARGGIASFAVSAIDIALWDIRAKKADFV